MAGVNWPIVWPAAWDPPVSGIVYTKSGLGAMGINLAQVYVKAGTGKMGGGSPFFIYDKTSAGGVDPEPPSLDQGNPPQATFRASGSKALSGVITKAGAAVSVRTGSGAKVFTPAVGPNIKTGIGISGRSGSGASVYTTSSGVVHTKAGRGTSIFSGSGARATSTEAPPLPPLSIARSWRYVVTDLDGNALGEPFATGRSVSFGISQTATASFTIRSDDPLWDEIADDETMLKVYDSTNTLRFYGPCVADEEGGSGQGSSVRVTASDLSWRLGKRFVGKDPTGVGLKYTSTDVGAIASNVLSRVNTDAPTGITLGTVGTFFSLTTTYLWKPALAAITELGSLAGSYEWTLRYVDGTPPTVYLDLIAQLGSDSSSNVFFEYGTGLNNCQAYTRLRTRDRLATHVWALGSGSTLTAAASDAAAAASHRSRYEDVLSYGDITIPALLDALAAAHVSVRAQPRKVFSVTPFVTGPVFGDDYELGDRVTCRIIANDSIRGSPTSSSGSGTWRLICREAPSSRSRS
jgi:hypothetical protein